MLGSIHLHKGPAMRTYLILMSFMWASLGSFGQAPIIQWQLCVGGSGDDQALDVVQRPDGGFIAVGSTTSDDGDVALNQGGIDLWVVAVSADGVLEWERTFGGTDMDIAFSVAVSGDGGYLIAGHTMSLNGDVTGNHGFTDAWLLKIDGTGELIWQRAYGGSAFEGAKCVRATMDGGFVFCGFAGSVDGDVSGVYNTNNPNCNPTLCDDFWVVKTDADGEIAWQGAYGGGDGDYAHSIVQMANGGYTAAGVSTSQDGDVSDPHGTENLWVVRLDPDGILLGEHSFGGTQYQGAEAIAPGNEGGSVVCGHTYSQDGDVIGQHGDADRWIFGMDANGSLLWQRPLGGSQEDSGTDLIRTLDGVFVASGLSSSNDGDATAHQGIGDAWVTALDSTGQLLWQYSFGGSDADGLSAVQETEDLGFIAAGGTRSNDGDVFGNHGAWDLWLVKLSAPTTGVGATTDQFDIRAFQPAGERSIMITGRDLDRCKSFSILDATGRVVLDGLMSAQGMSVDMGESPTGMYLLDLRIDGDRHMCKVILR